MNEITKSCAAGVLIGAALLFGVEKTAKAEQRDTRSVLALDLMELNRLAAGGAGALVEKLRWRVSMELIAAGLHDFRGGC